MTITPTYVETRLPAQDLDRARGWYLDKLGLQPTEVRPGGLRYQSGATAFCLFSSTGSSNGAFTQLAIEVVDIEQTVRNLLARRVIFERADGASGEATELDDIIIDIDHNYPSRGHAERGAFFRDSENNMLSLGQPVRRTRPPQPE